MAWRTIASTAVLFGCTISGNSAEYAGGGVDNVGTATLVDCTITGDSAQGDGGGIYGTTPSLYACTISGDSGQVGGGLYCSGGGKLIDTIVAGNTKTGGDIAGKAAASVTGSFNLIGTGGSGGIVGGTDGNIVLTSLAGLDLALAGRQWRAYRDHGLALRQPRRRRRYRAQASLGRPAGRTSRFAAGHRRVPDPIWLGNRGCPGHLHGHQDSRRRQYRDSALGRGTGRFGASASTIDFSLGTAPATITLSQGQLELSNPSQSITIDGPGASLVSVSGNNASRAFLVDPTVAASISGLTITGGKPAPLPPDGRQGGGLLNEGTVTLSGCTISGNTNYYGGGLYDKGTATLSDCTISGNKAFSDGGGVESSPDGILSLSNCSISRNLGQIEGGGLDANGPTTTLSDCTISDNSTHIWGGGAFLYGNTALFSDCTISGNTAPDSYSQGGGVVIRGGVHATFTGCTIAENSASYFGGIYNLAGTTTLTNCTISGNSAVQGNVGGIENRGSISLTGCTISGNSAKGVGGGLGNFYACEAHRMHDQRQLRDGRRRTVQQRLRIRTVTTRRGDSD